MTMIENECFNCVKMVSHKVMTIDNQKGYRWHKEALGSHRNVGGVGSHYGASGGVRGIGDIRGILGADRECRYSGPEGA